MSNFTWQDGLLSPVRTAAPTRGLLRPAQLGSTSKTPRSETWKSAMLRTVLLTCSGEGQAVEMFPKAAPARLLGVKADGPSLSGAQGQLGSSGRRKKYHCSHRSGCICGWRGRDPGKTGRMLSLFRALVEPGGLGGTFIQAPGQNILQVAREL